MNYSASWYIINQNEAYTYSMATTLSFENQFDPAVEIN